MDILSIPCDSACRMKITCGHGQDALIAAGLCNEIYSPGSKDAQNEARYQKNITVM